VLARPTLIYAGSGLALLAAIAWFAAASPRWRIVDRQIMVAAGEVPIAVRILVSPVETRYLDRYAAAARDALAQYTDWFGPFPHALVTIASAAARTARARESIVVRPVPQPLARTAIARQVSAALARRYWRGESRDDARLLEGVALFAADRVLPRESQARAEDNRRLTRQARLRSSRVEREAPAEVEVRTARALLTLERHLGWAALQPALLALRSRTRAAEVTASDLIRILEELTARDLGWARGLFDPRQVYDHAVDDVRVERIGESRYRSTVVLRRLGEGSVGPLTLRVRFADGQQRDDVWDARQRAGEMIYESASPLVEAILDPDAALAVETARENNHRSIDEDAGLLRRWARRLQPRLPAVSAGW
jgi:hypothetical protein